MSMTDLGGRGTGSGLRWSFVVPKDWWEVPLGNPGQTNAAIKRLVQAQFGYADADGGAKRRVRADLTALAGEAAAAGARGARLRGGALLARQSQGGVLDLVRGREAPALRRVRIALDPRG